MPVPEHLQKARAFLQDAQLCADHGRYDSAVSRAYYAMFRAAIALLERVMHFAVQIYRVLA